MSSQLHQPTSQARYHYFGPRPGGSGTVVLALYGLLQQVWRRLLLRALESAGCPRRHRHAGGADVVLGGPYQGSRQQVGALAKGP
jgi:hypothetical protein